nr:MAG TPA: hypothetical protein [Caudoviricetes sp.]
MISAFVAYFLFIFSRPLRFLGVKKACPPLERAG